MKMKWIKNSAGWKVVRFPFFNLFVREEGGKYGDWRVGWHDTLEEAQEACISRVSDTITDPDYKMLHYTDWCNNNGDGRYLCCWQKYHWLEGGVVETSYTSKSYALRFDITTSKEAVLHKSAVLQRRHIKRFLRAMTE